MLSFRQFVILSESDEQHPGLTINAEDHPSYKKRSAEDVNLRSDGEIRDAINSHKTSKKIYDRQEIPNQGDLVGVRTNLSVLATSRKDDGSGNPIPRSGIAVATIHKPLATTERGLAGHKKNKGFYTGRAQTYASAVNVKNAHFNANQQARNNIASGIANKSVMASVDGEYQDKKHGEHNYDGVELHFNPHREHGFVDGYGNLVHHAKDLTYVNGRVLARGPITYHTAKTAPKKVGNAPSTARIADPNNLYKSNPEMDNWNAQHK